LLLARLYVCSFPATHQIIRDLTIHSLAEEEVSWAVLQKGPCCTPGVMGVHRGQGQVGGTSGVPARTVMDQVLAVI
jgi:hypothetical protein